MSLTFVGNCEWAMVEEPSPGKNDWGMDTLELVFSGRSDKYENFTKTLSQKATYNWGGGTFALQSWTPSWHRSFPTVTLRYKGLINGRIPDPRYSDSTSQKSTSVTTTVGGEERTYDILYVSPQVVMRYITNTRGFSQMPVLTGLGVPLIFASSYVDPSTGRRRSGNPSGISMYGLIESKNQEPIDGTPWFETEVTASGVVLQA